MLYRDTNQGETVPAAWTVDKRVNRKSRQGAIMAIKLTGMVGLPLICILFNITFFIIGMSN